MALLMNPAAAALPWELMQARIEEGGEPLSVATGMLRQLLISDGRDQPLRAAARTALVVGNPLVADGSHPPLERASAEAGAVSGLLEAQGYTVRTLRDGDANTLAIYSAVHERPWRILHVAAHGVFERRASPAAEPLTGILLEDAVFTPADADQMTYVPDLVFINCCYLGSTRAEGDGAPHRLAANLATQFIRMGARAVVAAGWAVEDDAAHTFATTFYTRMLGGSLFGDAIVAARLETFVRHPGVNTWGAYQCYGDPAFSLGTTSSHTATATFVAPRELVVWLDRIRSRARERQGDETALLQDLKTVESQVPAAWWASAEVCASAGAAFAELGDLRQAIEYYARATTAEKAQAPLWALEQLVSCRVRLAGELANEPEQAAAAHAQLQEAENLLTHLLALGRTSERLSLRGALMKRRALLAGLDTAARRAALREMSAAYGEAFVRSRTPAQPLGLAYPLANQVAAEIVLAWTGDGSPELDRMLTQLEHAADAHAAAHTDFFSLAAVAECRLLQALRVPALDDTTRRALRERYLAALSRGITTRQLASVRTMFAFFQTLIAAERPDGSLAATAAQLRALEEEIAANA